MNLISNAIKFTSYDKVGKISIGAIIIGYNWGVNRGEEFKQYIEVFVQDEGIGILDTEYESIFMPHY